MKEEKISDTPPRTGKDDKKKKKKKTKGSHEPKASEDDSHMSSALSTSAPGSSRDSKIPVHDAVEATLTGDVDPPGFYIGDNDNNSHFPTDFNDPQGNTSEAEPHRIHKKGKTTRHDQTEKSALIQSIHDVEERLKAREQFKLVIHKIELSKLISAHRLLKNQPWLRAAYGQTVTWTLPSPQRLHEDRKTGNQQVFERVRSSCNGEGSAADWSGVDWSFLIERNHSDRQDFVLAVCSRDVVLGRYVLSRDDLSELLSQQTSIINAADGKMFLVEGEVVNDLGKAGRVALICSVVHAEKQAPAPSPFQSPESSPVRRKLPEESKESTAPGAAPMPAMDDAAEDAELSRLQPQPPLDDEPLIGGPSLMDQSLPEGVQEAVDAEAIVRSFVVVRVLGAAVMDLKAVHLFEPNSPVLSAEAGAWCTQTEVRRHAGMAAKWTGLFWKVTVRRDVGLLVSVTSLDKLVGRALLSTEELLTAPVVQLSSNVQVRQVVKTLSSGSDYTGRVKLNMVVNRPDDVVDALQLEAADKPQTQLLPPSLTPSQAAQLPHQPFQVMVREGVALEISVPAWLRLLRPGGRVPVTLHCAAGSWAQSTQAVQSDGRLAHWLGLGWAVPLLTESAAMRLTLWCGDVSVGAASLSPLELRTVLLTGGAGSGGTGEVLTQLRDARGHVAAKLKLFCRFDALPTASDGTLLSRPGSALSRPSSALSRPSSAAASPARRDQRPISALGSIPEHRRAASPLMSHSASERHVSQTAAGPRGRPLSAGLFLPEQGQLHSQRQLSAGLRGSDNPLLAPTQFPLLLTFVELALVDLLLPPSMLGALPAFLANPSGPVLQLLCDRQALSTASLHADAQALHLQTSARWSHLPARQWTVRVRSDSSFAVAVSMRRGQHVQPLGRALVAPDQLLGLPVDYDGFAQITVPLRNSHDEVAGRVVLRMLVRGAPDDSGAVAAAAPDDSLFQTSTLQGEGVDGARRRIEEMQRRAREEVGRLRAEAQQMPAMPWHDDAAAPPADGAAAFEASVGSFAAWAPSSSGQAPRSASPSQKPVVFDPRLVRDAAESLRHDLQFRVCVDEVDLWELRRVHRLQRNDPRVAAASGKWTASTIAASQLRRQSRYDDAADVASDRCFWTRLDWRFAVAERQQRLRLTVTSRGKVVGGAVFLVEDLMEVAADERGLRRVTGELLGGDDDFAGHVQLTFHMDVTQSPAVQHRGGAAATSHRKQPRPAPSAALPPMLSGSLLQDDGEDDDSGGYAVPAHVLEPRRFSASSQGAQYQFGAEPSVLSRAPSLYLDRGHTMDMVDADEIDRQSRPQFPCVLLLRDLAALDLLPLQTGKSLLQLSRQKNKRGQFLDRVCIEVYAENFFQTTEVDSLGTDFHTFLQLNWSVVVQESSVVRLVVRDARKVEIGHCDLLPAQLWAVPQNSAGVREVMLTLERDGLCSGKLIARAVFSPLPPLLIQQMQLQQSSHAPQRHVHAHNGSAGAGVVVDEHRFSDSVSVSYSTRDERPPAEGQSRPRRQSHQRLQPGTLLEHSVVSDGGDHSGGSAQPDITYVVDPPGVGRSRLQSGQESLLSESPFQSRRSSLQPSGNQHMLPQRATSPSPPHAVTTRDILGQAPSAALPVHSTFFPALVQSPPQRGRGGGSVVSATASQAPLPVRTPFLSAADARAPPPHLDALSLPSLGTSLVLPDTLEAPLLVVVRAVALIDLPRAHTFSTNQPVCSIACGRFTAAFPAHTGQGDGQSAAWDNLSVSFAFDKGAQLRIHVTSRGTTVGICSLSRARILSGRRSAQSGAFVIVDELAPAHAAGTSPTAKTATLRAAGKLKLVYDLPDLTGGQAPSF